MQQTSPVWAERALQVSGAQHFELFREKRKDITARAAKRGHAARSILRGIKFISTIAEKDVIFR